jgi:hypothetical protein
LCSASGREGVTVAQVEQAAIPIPGRTNGSAKPGPPAPLLGEPAPEQSALARAKVATLADPGLTTAEKVCALTCPFRKLDSCVSMV